MIARTSDSRVDQPALRLPNLEREWWAKGAIEPPTRGFSVPGRNLKLQLHQPVRPGARCNECTTMQDRAGLIHAKLPQSYPTPDLLVRRRPAFVAICRSRAEPKESASRSSLRCGVPHQIRSSRGG